MSSEDAAVIDERAERRRKRQDQQKGGAADPQTAMEDALLSAHRIAMSVGDLSAFRDADVSIAEWAVLRAVGDRRDVPLKEINANAVGVSRQRIRKLLSGLEAKELLTVGKADAADKRERTISATATTTGVLAKISEQIQAVLGKNEKDKGSRGRRLVSAARSLDRLAKQLRRVQAADKPRRRRKVEGAGAADEQE